MTLFAQRAPGRQGPSRGQEQVDKSSPAFAEEGDRPEDGGGAARSASS
jgi:hypothetical protein